MSIFHYLSLNFYGFILSKESPPALSQARISWRRERTEYVSLTLTVKYAADTA